MKQTQDGYTFCVCVFFSGRFDESVIEERRQSALDLLNFAGKDPHLFTSHPFVSFFEVSDTCSLVLLL